MDIQTFVTLLMVFSTICGIITQAIKNGKSASKAAYSSNLIALIVGFVTGFCGTMLYIFVLEIPLTGKEICIAVIMGIAVWISSMCGYDKVKQMIEQIGGTR